MNDKIKLIIEITKEHYEATKKLDKKYPYMLAGGETAIAHGIPLDDVKAEIKTFTITEKSEYDIGFNDAVLKCFNILDNIGKESEDTVRNARKVTKKDSHKEWWDSFYKGEVKPNE